MLRRFECPHCGKMLAESDGHVVKTNCRRCRQIVSGRALDLQMTLECKQCGRRHYYETPDQRPTYCVVCGLGSLLPVPALKRPTEVPTPATSGSQA